MYVRGWGWGGGGGVQGVGPVQAPMSSDNFDAVIDLRILLGNIRNACFSPTFCRQIEKWEPSEKNFKKIVLVRVKHAHAFGIGA